jgi:hypothetical protein
MAGRPEAPILEGDLREPKTFYHNAAYKTSRVAINLEKMKVGPARAPAREDGTRGPPGGGGRQRAAAAAPQRAAAAARSGGRARAARRCRGRCRCSAPRSPPPIPAPPRQRQRQRACGGARAPRAARPVLPCSRRPRPPPTPPPPRPPPPDPEGAPRRLRAAGGRQLHRPLRAGAGRGRRRVCGQAGRAARPPGLAAASSPSPPDPAPNDPRPRRPRALPQPPAPRGRS